ncbi:PEP-CTERM sorting domain-containing protein [Fundidesulfovibrio terrae]|uniref:PEP-CTERM sorting domain-containing protein n=1 Tax=Fundidesulfovibrio terrae TaxID=2922866 RepID=UPI001FAFCC54
MRIPKYVMMSLMVVLFVAQQSVAAPVVLPDPTVYAHRYDDFYSYSAKLLTAWGFTGFDGPAGVGGLDLVIGTHAGGANNNPVSGGFKFPDPMTTPSGNGAGSSTFSGTWGLSGTFAPVMVDDLVSYLHTAFGSNVNTPVFDFDMSQSQDKPNLYVNGVVKLLDASNNVVAYWSFDNVADHVFDPASYVLSPATITATNPAAPFNTVTVDNNKGSGKNDFIVYAPGMDLSLYTGKGLRFSAFFEMNSLTGGGEDLFLTGSFQPKPPVTTPEPGTMLLMGMGAVGAAFMRKRAKRSS